MRGKYEIKLGKILYSPTIVNIVSNVFFCAKIRSQFIIIIIILNLLLFIAIIIIIILLFAFFIILFIYIYYYYNYYYHIQNESGRR